MSSLLSAFPLATHFLRLLSTTALLTLTAHAFDPTPLFIPNFSFEAQTNSYVNINIDSWQKAPKPLWYEESGGFLWSQLVGAFKNTPPTSPDHIDNCEGAQAIWLFAVPEVALSQDYDSSPTHTFNATFEVGKTYTLSVAIIGGGGGMLEGASLQLSLYYRDLSGNKLPVASTSVVHSDATFPPPYNHFTTFQVTIPTVKPTDPWAGKKIGIQFLSTVTIESQGGYWDIDNVRLASTPDPRLSCSPAGSQARVAFLAATGYTFQLQSTENLLSPNWIPAASPLTGNGTEAVSLFPLSSSPRKFFRLAVTPTP